MKRTRSDSDGQTSTDKEAKLSSNTQSLAELQALIVSAAGNGHFEEIVRLSAQAYILQGMSKYADPELENTEHRPLPDSASFDEVTNAIEHVFCSGLRASLNLHLARHHHLVDSTTRSARLSLNSAGKEAMQLVAMSNSIANNIEKVKIECNVSLIHELPNELLLQVFAELGTADRLCCWHTNQRWNQLVSPILKGRTLCLRGTVEYVDKEWIRCDKLIKRAKIVSLSVILKGNAFKDFIGHYHGQDTDFADTVRRSEHDEGVLYRWRGTQLLKSFPYKILRKVSYSSDNYVLDKPFWKCITKCENLKVLIWKAGNILYESDFRSPIVKYKVANTPLAACTLEKIDLEASEDPEDFVQDKAFKELCKKAKHFTLSPDMDLEMEDSSKDSSSNDEDSDD